MGYHPYPNLHVVFASSQARPSNLNLIMQLSDPTGVCAVYLNKGDLALEDATLCVLERPDWPKAYYRAGAALKLLNMLDDVAGAFFKGLKVDPKNKELQDAFREATLDRSKAINVQL